MSDYLKRAEVNSDRMLDVFCEGKRETGTDYRTKDEVEWTV